ncbi:patatin-like phospholipase family protein [Streptomyces sp. NPDC001773]|uniref:patatin-like phospholipase family protein n=1 Tax=unclassified Streptomyces TaxID=2593676 RepID=UPI0033B44E7C
MLGAAHVGVGYALEKHGFVPDLIIGTSVGALNGAIAAAHPDRAAPWLDHVWTQLRRREVYPLGSLSSRASIFTDRGLRRLIARAGLPSRIERDGPHGAAAATRDRAAPGPRSSRPRSNSSPPRAVRAPRCAGLPSRRRWTRR